MEIVSIPVPAERSEEFVDLFARWVATPPGTHWAPEVAEPGLLAWDSTRAGEGAVAAAAWAALTPDQQKLVDTVAAAGPIEPCELGTALGLGGELATMQAVAAVNAVAAAHSRQALLPLTPTPFAILVVDRQAFSALTGRPWQATPQAGD